jgi:hypothetical protein
VSPAVYRAFCAFIERRPRDAERGGGLAICDAADLMAPHHLLATWATSFALKNGLPANNSSRMISELGLIKMVAA